jgi:predicted aspartyl protease
MLKWFLLLGVLFLLMSMDALAPIAAQTSPYTVDGLALGGHVHFESQAYRQFHCTPSEKFAGFTWCHKDNIEKTNRGEIASSNSILHSQDGTAVYVNRYIEPAFFGGNDVRTEIDRLSTKFGERAREFRMPPREGFPNAIMAVWGKIDLVQLSAADISIVASGGSIKGLLVSFLGDLQHSANVGVPVYRLAGGAGFLWVATFNKDGRGVLRYLTIDASQIASPEVAQNPRASPPIASSPQSEVSSSLSGGSTLVPLLKEGGIYLVPALINNAITLNFVVDSGAADVSIPADVVLTLVRTGTLQATDFIGAKTYQLPDGSSLPSTTFRIQSLTVGGEIVENVTAAVVPVTGSLLLGQSFLSRFGLWSIDNNKQSLVLGSLLSLQGPNPVPQQGGSQSFTSQKSPPSLQPTPSLPVGTMPAQGQPVCVDHDALLRVLVTSLLAAQGKITSDRISMEGCQIIQKGSRVEILERYPSDSTIGHVVKVRVTSPMLNDAVVGFSLELTQ